MSRPRPPASPAPRPPGALADRSSWPERRDAIRGADYTKIPLRRAVLQQKNGVNLERPFDGPVVTAEAERLAGDALISTAEAESLTREEGWLAAEVEGFTRDALAFVAEASGAKALRVDAIQPRPVQLRWSSIGVRIIAGDSMKLLKTLAAVLVAMPLAWSSVAFADDGRERERKYEEWAREDAKRHDAWMRESYKRDAESRREHAKDQREYAREARKRAEEYWRERDKAEAEAYRDWLKERSRSDRDYRRAYELNGQIGRVIIGEPWYEQDDD